MSRSAPTPVAFGSDITSPDSNAKYTGAFPAGPDGTSTILTYVVNGDNPGVVWQLVDAAGQAGTPQEGTQIELAGDADPPRAACDLVATTLHGSASVSTLYFVERPAEGVVPAEYDAYLYTWDGAGGSDPVAKTVVAEHVRGKPSCDVHAEASVVSKGDIGSEGENQWAINGTTDSRNDVVVSYRPAQESEDSAEKHVFVSIDNDTVTPITMQSFSFVVGNGVVGGCGSDSMDATPCSVSVDGTAAKPSVSCGGDANCTYSTLYGSGGLAVEADDEQMDSSEMLGRILDPLTGAVRFTTPKGIYPEKSAYDAKSHTIVVLSKSPLGDKASELLGFDATSGAKLWSVAVSDLCGSNVDGVLVAANDQLALLSPRDGKQIASTDAVSRCTPGPGAGIGITGDGGLISLLDR